MPNINKFTPEQLKKYLSKPDNERPFARYQESHLNPKPAFLPEEVRRLTEIVAHPSVQYSKHQLNRLLIDLSWASSRLEGNTYTQLETQTLIEYGTRNAEKHIEDAAMILNHKRAIEYLLENIHIPISKNVILAIHDLLSEDTLVPDSRHFLEKSKRGVIRSYTEDGIHIQGSSYLPPQAEDRGAGYIHTEFAKLISSANAFEDAINQSFFLFTRIPYLQPFYDANKRTSRISCNMPLLRKGLTPISFVGMDKTRYIEGLIAFYELGDEQLIKGVFLEAHIASAFRYLPFSENERVILAGNRKECLEEACSYVVTGGYGNDPIWLLNKNQKEMLGRSRPRPL